MASGQIGGSSPAIVAPTHNSSKADALPQLRSAYRNRSLRAGIAAGDHPYDPCSSDNTRALKAEGVAIVVGFIRTDEGHAALDRGIVEARLRDTRLLIVHSSKGGHGEDVENVVAYREELEQLDQRLAAEGLDDEIKQLTRGKSPAEDLLGLAENADIDMIVIGVRRRSPVGKMILGSNTREILLDAACPVLAVKPRTD